LSQNFKNVSEKLFRGRNGASSNRSLKVEESGLRGDARALGGLLEAAVEIELESIL
jgi:hypothetical protein